MTDPTAERIVDKFLDIHGFQVVSMPPAQHPSDARAELISILTTALVEARREGWEEVIHRVNEQVQYDEKFRLGDIEKLRSGWSGIESGPCCKKCLIDEKRPPNNPLQAGCGCWNPFQLPGCCECHLPFRKVAGESISLKIFIFKSV